MYKYQSNALRASQNVSFQSILDFTWSWTQIRSSNPNDCSNVHARVWATYLWAMCYMCELKLQIQLYVTNMLNHVLYLWCPWWRIKAHLRNRPQSLAFPVFATYAIQNLSPDVAPSVGPLHLDAMLSQLNWEEHATFQYPPLGFTLERMSDGKLCTIQYQSILVMLWKLYYSVSFKPTESILREDHVTVYTMRYF